MFNQYRSWKLYPCPYSCATTFPRSIEDPQSIEEENTKIYSLRYDSIEPKGIYYFGKGNISIRIRVLETGRKKVVGGRNERDPLFPRLEGAAPPPPPLFLVNRNQSEAVTCGNRDNYNVSARFRRDAGRMPVITKPPPPHWNRPAGGESTLMLAPVTGNHPRPVFQSVSFAI